VECGDDWLKLPLWLAMLRGLVTSWCLLLWLFCCSLNSISCSY